MKRIALFLATNLAIVLVLSLSVRLLGLESSLGAQGLDLGALLVFAALMGFGGSFLSLALSKWTAKRAMGVRVIDTPADASEAWLVQTVQRQAERAGIGMPEVGIYDADEVNAFATGTDRRRARARHPRIEGRGGVLPPTRIPRRRGRAEPASRPAMIAAPRRPDCLHPQLVPDKMAAFAIAGGAARGWKRLFMTHPPLTERIRALEEMGARG